MAKKEVPFNFALDMVLPVVIVLIIFPFPPANFEQFVLTGAALIGCQMLISACRNSGKSND